jgi:hypothetical protein
LYRHTEFISVSKVVEKFKNQILKQVQDDDRDCLKHRFMFQTKPK